MTKIVIHNTFKIEYCVIDYYMWWIVCVLACTFFSIIAIFFLSLHDFMYCLGHLFCLVTFFSREQLVFAVTHIKVHTFSFYFIHFVWNEILWVGLDGDVSPVKFIKQPINGREARVFKVIILLDTNTHIDHSLKKTVYFNTWVFESVGVLNLS